ncbi:MAG TPA: SMP-30/gluconolactonase/LRE family protein, partial [Myxococcota bacterium]|nr:SMP-30/gluconolactonase/LRE family protein [Myxococcota bacterium]
EATRVADRGPADAFICPNDLVVAKDGSIYVTDTNVFSAAPQPSGKTFIWRIGPTGAVTPVWQGTTLSFPNGITLSPDGATLYFNDTYADTVSSASINADGSLSNVRVIAALPHTRTDPCDACPDGMKVDVAGNLFVATRGGVRVFKPDGTPWGVLAAPHVWNLAFGGPARTTLYLTAPDLGLYAITLQHPGVDAVALPP